MNHERENVVQTAQLSFATARLVLKLEHLRGFEQLFNSFTLSGVKSSQKNSQADINRVEIKEKWSARTRRRK